MVPTCHLLYVRDARESPLRARRKITRSPRARTVLRGNLSGRYALRMFVKCPFEYSVPGGEIDLATRVGALERMDPVGIRCAELVLQ